MAQGQKSNRALVRGAEQALDRFKYEVASQLQIDQTKIRDGYWGDLPARECGAVGGQMVRRMIQLAEQSLANQGTQPVTGQTQRIRPTP
ncbi:MAG: alpha/beta-type small acid-soluble spore protein [Firmicutes bacterium]|nr:alpha/beta-type small acid-soluble spore protein [Bacillota bacterium]